MHVFPKKEVLARQPSPKGIPLNVALIMFDSTSAANFRRKMPNSLEYLTNNLNSLLMRGEVKPVSHETDLSPCLLWAPNLAGNEGVLGTGERRGNEHRARAGSDWKK